MNKQLNLISFILALLLLASGSFAVVGQHHGSSDLILDYHFEEGSDGTCSDGADTCDLSGNNLNGSNILSPSWVAGVNSTYALGFDTTNYVNASNNSLLNVGNGSFTIMSWIKTTDTDEGDIIFKLTLGAEAGWGISIDINGKASLWASEHGFTSVDVIGTTTVNDGNWHHLAGVRNGNDFIFYVDGVNESEDTVDAGNLNNTYPFYIGGGEWGIQGTFFNGTIDEVRLFSVALTQEQVQIEMTLGINGFDTTLDAIPDFSVEASTDFTLWGDYEMDYNNSDVLSATCTYAGDISGSLTYNASESRYEATDQITATSSTTITCLRDGFVTRASIVNITLLTGYIPTYDSSDLSPIAVDGVATLGVGFVGYAGLIVIILFFSFIIIRLRMRK